MIRETKEQLVGITSNKEEILGRVITRIYFRELLNMKNFG